MVILGYDEERLPKAVWKTKSAGKLQKTDQKNVEEFYICLTKLWRNRGYRKWRERRRDIVRVNNLN